MLPDRVSNPGPLTYEPGALPIALLGPAVHQARPETCRTGSASGLVIATLFLISPYKLDIKRHGHNIPFILTPI